MSRVWHNFSRPYAITEIKYWRSGNNRSSERFYELYINTFITNKFA
jgi:hypothetical protein